MQLKYITTFQMAIDYCKVEFWFQFKVHLAPYTEAFCYGKEMVVLVHTNIKPAPYVHEY